MAYVCRKCGKNFSTSVLKHYEKFHKDDFLIYESRIEAHPNWYAADAANIEDVESLKALLQKVNPFKVASSPKRSSAQTTIDPNDKAYIKRRSMFKQVLEEYPDKQRYRGKEIITCDVCGKKCSSGMVIFSSGKWRVCYDCYNSIKKEVPPKPRARRMIPAGIPGLGKRH